MHKEQLPFGQGSFVGDIMADDQFFNLPEREQAIIVGWADSCPVVLELTDPQNPNPGRGPKEMLNRYGEVNFWFGELARLAGDLNPQLGKQLLLDTPRQAGEPAGKHEPASVPESYQKTIAPMGTLTGYSLPRIFIEQLGLAEDISMESRQERLVSAIDIFSQAATHAETPLELLAQTAEGIITQGDINPTRVLKHVFSQGWLAEHNTHGAVAEFRRVVREQAPAVTAAYDQLSEEDKAELKLV